MDERSGHVIIVGCGRVGSGLAARLAGDGLTIAVIDTNAASFSRLRDLPVERIEGVGFDRATLVEAGAERALGLAAVTNGDNTNIVVARTAREAFAIPRVVARIFDVRRAAIYQRLGIPTVASAQLTMEMAMRHLRPDDEPVRWLDPSARVALLEWPAPAHLIGRRAVELETDGVMRLVAVQRLGSGVLVTAQLVVQDGDVLYVAVDQERVDEANRLLGGDRSAP
jgi:trk system potassium uptake protein TrkA